MPALNPPQIVGGGSSTPTWTSGLFGLNAGFSNLTTGASGAKAGANTALGSVTSDLERIDLTAFTGLGRTYLFDLFVAGVKKVTDLPLRSGSAYHAARSLRLHIPNGSAVAYNAATNSTQSFNVEASGYACTVAETITIIEPIGPVGAVSATQALTTGTALSIPNGSATSGWTCINPAGASANAYKVIYPHLDLNNVFAGRSTLTGTLELGYADDAAGTTNFVNLGVQRTFATTASALVMQNLADVLCDIPAGKYFFARLTTLTNSSTAVDSFNVQLHGGR